MRPALRNRRVPRAGGGDPGQRRRVGSPGAGDAPAQRHRRREGRRPARSADGVARARRDPPCESAPVDHDRPPARLRGLGRRRRRAVAAGSPCVASAGRGVGRAVGRQGEGRGHAPRRVGARAVGVVGLEHRSRRPVATRPAWRHEPACRERPAGGTRWPMGSRRGGAGAAALIGALVGFSHLPVAWWAAALLMLAVFGFAVDVQAGGLGVWTFIGGGSLVVGSITLYGGDARLNPPWWVLAIVIVGTALFMLGAMTAAVPSRLSPPTNRGQRDVGQEGQTAG